LLKGHGNSSPNDEGKEILVWSPSERHSHVVNKFNEREKAN
jgi:hypothetical protein